VTLRSTAQYSGSQALTDLAGRFRIDNVLPGTYTLFATAQGYVVDVPDASLGPPPANTVSVSDGQTVKDRALSLVPYGAISGRVLDEGGEPIAAVAVEALTFSYSRSGRALRATRTAATNDRGEYRLFDLAPGRWYLEVSKYTGTPSLPGHVHSSVIEEGYAATFYPGVKQSSAAGAVEVPPAADLRQFDFSMRLTPVYHLRGKTLDTRTGQPAAGAAVQVYRCGDDRGGAFGALKTGPSGDFDFKGLTPGCYWLASELAGLPKLVAPTSRVTLADRDVDDVVFRLEPAFSLRGVVLLEEGSPDRMRAARVVLEPGAGIAAGGAATIDADGTFTVPNLAPATYRVHVDRVPGLYLKSVRLGDLDASSDFHIDATPGAGPLTIVLRGDSGQLAGVASPAPTFLPLRITVAPDGALAERLDLLHTFEPSEPGGAFHIAGLAPGDYKIFAWQTDDEALVEYPEFRKLLESKAASLTVTPHGQANSELRAITAAEIQEARGRLR
jgi:protocatechuate 3,4-dioxygenase beta subunit